MPRSRVFQSSGIQTSVKALLPEVVLVVIVKASPVWHKVSRKQSTCPAKPVGGRRQIDKRSSGVVSRVEFHIRNEGSEALALILPSRGADGSDGGEQGDPGKTEHMHLGRFPRN
jgi:hypothetical protein